MASKSLRTAALIIFLCAVLDLPACFVGGPYERPYYTAPAYTAPVYPAPVYHNGDWDEHHVWHERSWWVANRRPWVQQHHPDWLASRHDYPHH